MTIIVMYYTIHYFPMIHSGGNRRKLSTAIALVGNPPIVLLVSGSVCTCEYVPDHMV